MNIDPTLTETLLTHSQRGGNQILHKNSQSNYWSNLSIQIFSSSWITSCIECPCVSINRETTSGSIGEFETENFIWKGISNVKLAKEFGTTFVGEMLNERDIQSTGGFNNQASFGGIGSVDEDGDIVNDCVLVIIVFSLNS
ncbi:unnamed protein product [Rodentolepis nana]|uniref:Uncharacterized protein n=1 Tax=Rodentolepis nana TaxID=102285 RepID=A0A158QI37_RODNA|nr:unnamed protein product [Rodentolepis nana]